jgi:hypothetical protein
MILYVLDTQEIERLHRMASATGTYSLNGEAWRSNPAAVGFKPSKMNQPIDANWYRSRYSSRSSLIEPVKSAKIRDDYRNKELKPPTPNWQSWHFRQSSPQRSGLNVCDSYLRARPDSPSTQQPSEHRFKFIWLVKTPCCVVISCENILIWRNSSSSLTWNKVIGMPPYTSHYSENAVIYWCHYNLPTSTYRLQQEYVWKLWACLRNLFFVFRYCRPRLFNSLVTYD